MENAIQTQGLSKSYGTFPALVDLDLTVRTGEVFGFLGPNGAGKSTTIRVLMDELRATAGSAHLLGLDSHRDAVALHARLGYLPADVALYPQLTGREVIKFFTRLRKGKVDPAFVDELVNRFDADLGKKVGDLSTGNRQKVGLIVTFMHKPELLILDEPNAGLDPLVQHEFHQLMRETVTEGRTIFLSSHTLSEVERVADRVGIIRSGHLVAVEEIANLRSKVIRRIELTLRDEPGADEFDHIAGVSDVAVNGTRVTFSFDGDMEALLAAVMRDHTLHDISTSEADLEEIFLTYYRGTDDTPAQPHGPKRALEPTPEPEA